MAKSDIRVEIPIAITDEKIEGHLHRHTNDIVYGDDGVIYMWFVEHRKKSDVFRYQGWYPLDINEDYKSSKPLPKRVRTYNSYKPKKII